MVTKRPFLLVIKWGNSTFVMAIVPKWSLSMSFFVYFKIIVDQERTLTHSPLLIKISIFPKKEMAFSAWFLALLKSAKSKGRTATFASLHLAFTSKRFSTFRAERMSLQLLWLCAYAKAYPMPLEAPVIQTTLLFTDVIFYHQCKKVYRVMINSINFLL